MSAGAKAIQVYCDVVVKEGGKVLAVEQGSRHTSLKIRHGDKEFDMPIGIYVSDRRSILNWRTGYRNKVKGVRRNGWA